MFSRYSRFQGPFGAKSARPAVNSSSRGEMPPFGPQDPRRHARAPRKTCRVISCSNFRRRQSATPRPALLSRLALRPKTSEFHAISNLGVGTRNEARARGARKKGSKVFGNLPSRW
jgi:hypothetical protein